jgi:threonine/homoserine/homoserine lactone efflux protein
MQRGARTGIVITLGLCTGLIIHTLAVTVGLSAAIAASPLAFTLLRYAGAGYLLYLAFRLLQTRSAKPVTTTASVSSRHRDYARGVIMNLSNPKVLLFFLAFLPQFVVPATTPVAVQLIMLGTVFILCAFLVFATISLLAEKIAASLLSSTVAQRTLNTLSAILFIAVAFQLLLTTLW